MDKGFAKWWFERVEPFRDVAPEKLAMERAAVARMQEFNRNYVEFLQTSVMPAIGELVKVLNTHKIVHRVSTWGNQLSLRVHLAYRWGELVIAQTHEDAVTFDHNIVTEGEKRGDDASDQHTHPYDLRDPLPGSLAWQEIQFFMGRLAQDLTALEEEEGPPGN